MVTEGNVYLDCERSRKLGSFRPACGILKFLVKPAHGALIYHADGMHTYTRRRESMQDSGRFIFGNGAHERVDVTVIPAVSSDATKY